jgi:hypothetical protein
LYRLVSPDYIEPDGHVNLFAYCYRKSRKPDPAVSVDLARLVDKPEDTLIRSRLEGTRIGELSAVVPFGMGLTVTHCPAFDNWAHTEIRGARTQAECEQMARATNIRHERRTNDGISYD